MQIADYLLFDKSSKIKFINALISFLESLILSRKLVFGVELNEKDQHFVNKLIIS